MLSLLAGLPSSGAPLTPLSPQAVLVSIIGTENKPGGHTVYNVRVSSGRRTWTVERRYRQFDQLHRAMCKFLQASSLPTFPGEVLIPWHQRSKHSSLRNNLFSLLSSLFSLLSPGKRLFFSSRADVVAERKEGLQLYLKQLMGVPLVWQFEELLHFLDDERHTLAVQWDLLVRALVATLQPLTHFFFFFVFRCIIRSDGSDSLRC